MSESKNATTAATSSSVAQDLKLQLVCAGVAGLVSDGITHPSDTIRANLQLQKGRSSSTASVLRNLIRNRGLYRGFAMVGATTVPAHCLYFGGYEVVRAALAERKIEGFGAHLIAGLMADVFGAFVWVPADVVKQRVQVASDKSSWDAVKRVYQANGFRGFFRGYWASLLTYGPTVSIYFAVYELSKHTLESHNLVAKESMASQVFSGLFAGALSSAITNPLDVIKTRLQVDSRYNGVGDVFRKTLAEEGPRAFAKGMLARISWIAPSCAIGIVAYEQCKLLVGLRVLGRD